MAVRRAQHTDGAIFFCTFTCYRWLPLIEQTACHDHIYTWMHLAHNKGFRILGYVIMPNHVHLLIHAPEGAGINALLGNAKRFLAYEIVTRLKAADRSGTLLRLRTAVRKGDAARGQLHRVFETSSDIRECLDRRMLEQKLDYIHANPVSGKWSLAENAIDYPHSSMGFYLQGDTGPAPLTHYHDVLG